MLNFIPLAGPAVEEKRQCCATNSKVFSCFFLRNLWVYQHSHRLSDVGLRHGRLTSDPAASRPVTVRLRIRLCSNSANAPKMWNTSLPPTQTASAIQSIGPAGHRSRIIEGGPLGPIRPHSFSSVMLISGIAGRSKNRPNSLLWNYL